MPSSPAFDQVSSIALTGVDMGAAVDLHPLVDKSEPILHDRIGQVHWSRY